jgi:hypothetical protein
MAFLLPRVAVLAALAGYGWWLLDHSPGRR